MAQTHDAAVRYYRSAQCCCDLTKLGWRMLAGKRRSRDQILAFCQISDEHGFEASFPDQAARKVNRRWIVAGNGNSNDALSGRCAILSSDGVVERIERPYNPRTFQQLSCDEPGPALARDLIHKILAIARRGRVDTSRTSGLVARAGAEILSDLRDRGVGHDKKNDFAERDGFGGRAGAGGGARPSDQVLELFGMPGREHHRMAKLGE